LLEQWQNASGSYTTGQWELQVLSNVLSIYIATGASSYTQLTAPVSSNIWYHVAVVRSGTTVTMYLNGKSVSSATVSSAFGLSAYALTIGRETRTAAGYFSGQLSNVRITNTAVYTANFTPPTSNLTAVSGTQLLTLQNATIVDNSTNAFSITNSGSVVTAYSYPFATAIFNDQGPAGNNWTPNNISGISGSTLDYMTDVPTLTSATVANYAVINPLQNGGLTITNGNLTWAGAGSSVKCATGSIAMTSGKWYFEALITGSSGGNWYAGVCNLSPTLTSAPSATATGWGLVTGGGGTVLYKSNNNVLTSLSSSSVTGSVVSFAIDVDAGKIWFAQNGTWLEGSPSAGTGASYTNLTGTQVPYVAGYDSNDQGSINFGQRPFAYTPPSGFVALNTFNLPTPTIGATPATTANNYFNAVLYSGNNSTQNITVGFQPDFVWSKCRNVARSHRLSDAVRGSTRDLYSDTTAAEQNDG